MNPDFFTSCKALIKRPLSRRRAGLRSGSGSLLIIQFLLYSQKLKVAV